jgi:undecaprenyl-diphosphatase
MSNSTKSKKKNFSSKSVSRFQNTFSNYCSNCFSKYRFVFIPVVCLLLIIFGFLLDNIAIIFFKLIQCQLLTGFFYYITILGEPYIFFFVVLFLIIALLINNKKILPLVSALGVCGLLIFLLKYVIGRNRPFEVLSVDQLILTTGSSFPSGHTMLFFALIVPVGKNFPKLKIVLWSLAILVGISRMYLGVHYLSDVIAGAIFGYAIGALFVAIGEKYGWKY